MRKKSEHYLWQAKYFNQLTLDELYNILNLRIQVFMKEQNCLCPETDYCDQEALHLWPTNSTGRVLAYARILPPHTVHHGKTNTKTKIGRVVVKKVARGSGLSYLLMEKAISTMHELYLEDIEISAQAHLTSFYQKLGFVIDGKEFLEDGIPHIKMTLSSHLQ